MMKILAKIGEFFKKNGKMVLAATIAVVLTVSFTFGGAFLLSKLGGNKGEQVLPTVSVEGTEIKPETVVATSEDRNNDFVKGLNNAISNATGKYVTQEGEILDDNLVVGGSTKPESGAKYYDPSFVSTDGDMKLNGYFADDMMFQQERPIALWGFERPGQLVSVKLSRDSDRTVISQNSVKADDNGKFYIRIPAVKGSFETYTVVVEGSARKKYNNVLIGELWIAGGENSMEMPVKYLSNSADVLADATNSRIRFFQETVTETAKIPYPVLPETEVAPNFKWGTGADSDFVKEMSGTGYLFAKDLFNRLNVPVGVIDVAFANTSIECWLSRVAVENTDAIYTYLQAQNKYFLEQEINTKRVKTTVVNTNDPNKAFYNTQVNIENSNQMSVQYNKRIAPIRNAIVKGVIWNQGDSNVADAQATYYKSAMDTFIKEWSKYFGSNQKPLPIVSINIAPFNHTPEAIPLINEQVSDVQKLNKATFAVVPTYDLSLDFSSAITPISPLNTNNKNDIALRAVNAAMGIAYGSKNEYMAPVFDSAVVAGNKIIIKFSNVGEGLSVKDGGPELIGFAIAGATAKLYPAKAKITAKDTVEVTSAYVDKPLYATYAFSNYSTTSNLVNSIGIPALAFRTEKKMELYYYRAKEWTYLQDIVGWSATKTVTRTDSYKTIWQSFTDPASRAVNVSADKGQNIKDSYALKVDYSGGNDSIVVGVNANAFNNENQYTPYSKLSFKVYNPNGQTVTFNKLHISTSARNLFINNPVSIPPNSTVTIDANLWNLVTKNNAAEPGRVSIYNDLASIKFDFSDTAAGTVYIHSIAFRT